MEYLLDFYGTWVFVDSRDMCFGILDVLTSWGASEDRISCIPAWVVFEDS